MDKPLILSEGYYSQSELKAFKKENNVLSIQDIYKFQLAELYEILYPDKANNKKLQSEFFQQKLNPNPQLKGDWIYYPWSGVLLHLLCKEEYFLLRTNRNQNLITLDEQKRLDEFVVGIAGLSIGSNIATSLVYEGIANTMKLADVDNLQTTNLNRVKAKLFQLGKSKLDFISQEIYELNPYARLIGFPSGINKMNLENFICSKPIIKLIIDEIDDIEMKIRLRIKAKEYNIPVLMFSNVHNKIIIDIERYDLDSNLELFNGLLGNIPNDILLNGCKSESEKNQYAVKIVEKRNLSKRTLESVSQIGKTIVGRPQLSSTVTVSSGLAAYYTKQIALKKILPSQRKKFDLEK